MSFAICHFAYNIKSVELQPVREVTRGARLGIKFLGLREEELGCGVDEGLVLDESSHGEGAVDTPPELSMECFRGGAEE
jgi:hypothetical protein